MDENPLAGRRQRTAEVFVRIDDGIARIAVADFEIDDLAAAAVDQVVASPEPALKPAHMPGRNGVSPVLVTRTGSPSRM